MSRLSRRQFMDRAALAGGAVVAAMSPWATSLARAATAAAPGLNARRRATCTALAEVIADYPGAASNVPGAVEGLVASYNGSDPGHRATMVRVIDAVEACTPNGSFSAASKKERADALRRNTDELFGGPLRPGSAALMVDAGLAGIASHMVYEYRSDTPRPIPTY